MNLILSKPLVGLARFFVAALMAIVAAPLSAQSNPPLQWRPLHDPGVGGWVSSLSVSPHDPSLVLSGGDILGIARSNNGGLSWHRPSTPPGSYMLEEITWHPQSGNSSSAHYGEVWAATMAGPWKSTDFGQTWTFKRTGMPQPTGGVQDFRPAIQTILVDPSNNRRLLAFFGTHRLNNGSATFYDSGKVYVSSDGGENWSALATIATDTDTKRCLVTTAAYQLTGTGGATTIYAATRKGFFRSDDNGATWTQKSSGLPAADRDIRALTVHPTDGRTLWISVHSAGIYKSTDRGETWAAANTGISSPSTGRCEAIIVSPADGNLLFTSKIEDKILYRSTDGGATWVAQPSAAFGPSPYPVYRDIRCFAAHPTAPVIFAGTPTDIWKTTNASAANDLDGVAPYTGPYWDNVSSVQRNGGWIGTGYSGQVTNQFRWNPYNADEAAMAAMDGGKFVSRDALQSWTFAGGGRGKGVGDWHAFRDFSFSAVAGNWYALQGQSSTTNGFFRTTNGGSSWTSIATPVVGGVTASGDPHVVHVHRSNTSRVWVIWGGKLYYSASAGATGSWSQLAADSTVYGTAYDLVADPADSTGNTLWLGAAKGLFRSTDGSTFTQVAASGTAINISRVKLDPTNPARLWIVNAKNSNTNSYSTGLWRLVLSSAGSTTGTWTNLASWGSPTSPVRYIVDVAVDPTNGNRIAVGTSQDNFTAITAETGVWINDDNGASTAWRREINGLAVQRVRTVDFRPGTSELVAGTMGGGFYIADTDGSVIDLGPVVALPTSADLSASADAESRRVGLGDGGGTVTNLTATELFVGNANNSGSACSPVYAFQLPNVGAVANPFTSATFTVGLSTSATTFNGYNADVYGLPARASSDVLAADAFAGAGDTTDATKLQEDWINFNTSTAVATGLKTLSNSALVAYLNAQYASGAGAGKYVFLRLSPDTAGNTWKNIKFASFEYTANTAWRPRLVVE